jgi:hypothetical protein
MSYRSSELTELFKSIEAVLGRPLNPIVLAFCSVNFSSIVCYDYSPTRILMSGDYNGYMRSATSFILPSVISEFSAVFRLFLICLSLTPTLAVKGFSFTFIGLYTPETI